MPNFHYRVERAGEREAAPRREALDDLGDAEVRARWSRTAGATVRFSNAAHDAREHVPLFRPSPASGQRRIPRDKTKPGPCSLLSFIRGRGSSAPSGPVRLSRRTFSPTESMGVRPVPQIPLSLLPSGAWRFPTTTWSRHPRHPRPNARGSGFPEYFIYSPPRFFLFALLESRCTTFISLSLHLACFFFTSRLRLSIDALLLLRS